MENLKNTVPYLMGLLAGDIYRSQNSLSIIKFKQFIIIHHRFNKIKQLELYKKFKQEITGFTNDTNISKLGNIVLNDNIMLHKRYMYSTNNHIDTSPTNNCQVFSIKSADTIYAQYLHYYYISEGKSSNLINEKEYKEIFSDFIKFMHINYMLKTGSVESKRMIFLDVKTNVMDYNFLKKEFKEYVNTRGTQMKYGILNCTQEYNLSRSEQFDITILQEHDSAYDAIVYQYNRNTLTTEFLETAIKNNQIIPQILKKNTALEEKLPF